VRTILFLDITGVLFCGRCGHESCGHLPNLERIVSALGCELVLTTSFRFDARTTATLERRFAEHGIPGWIGVTPDLSSERWEEIREWVEHNAAGGDRLIILDDREDADLAAHAPGSYPNCHFFLADPATGLDEDLTDTVLRLAKAP
jgi:hypothetical protein